MKDHPDINDTMRDECADAVRDRHDKARKYEPESDGNGHDEAPSWEEARGEAPPDEAYGEPNNSEPTPPILSKSDFL